MDKVKEVIGLEKKDQEGQEPVSGKQGDTAAGQPFDAGNSKGIIRLFCFLSLDADHLVRCHAGGRSIKRPERFHETEVGGRLSHTRCRVVFCPPVQP